MPGHPKKNELRHVLRMAMLLILLLTGLILATARFRSFEVLGNAHYTKEELVEMIFSEPWDTNSFYQFVKEHTREHKQLPFVEKYELHWKGPLRMEIIVYEKKVIGYVDYMSSCMYFDKDGIVVESTGERLADVPEIDGLQFGSIVLFRPLPVENETVFNDILNLTGALSLHAIPCEHIHYDRLLNAELTVGELTVELGQNKNMEMKISTLADILPKLDGRKGSLDLSTYIEDRERESYIFKESQ